VLTQYIERVSFRQDVWKRPSDRMT
jgi:hypothetical protein